ncbi:MAG: Protein lysine SAM-dependent methyltransferase [Candidatus Methanohalarchaeum thermophilum]|uniref:Protein lysine SAM-dependent methyltransferase n=1 Tax=Methanohalarchaeum thermophilum TaxID=1903181 RepID=A0A1Q6DTY0_METT1|nr:MAG: Protein lysine SAM-dependent methyltransferase [Candidatus Methanohalarchaeum thermophilum]
MKFLSIEYILIIAAILSIFWLGYLQFWTAGWTPTPKNDIKLLIESLNVQDIDKIYELGCGDGRVLTSYAEHGQEVIGIEIDPIRYFISKIRAQISTNNNIKVIFGNYLNLDLSDADLVFVYLSEKANKQLEKKLSNELKGAQIISYTYKFPNLKEEKILKEGKRNIYIYTIQ